jgi:putative ABC transport system permease protein
MTELLRRAGGRHLEKHPLLRVLSVLGIALGVAVVVSIDVANDSALAAFALSRSAVMGRATHEVIGGPSGVPEAIFVRVSRDLGLEAAPVLEEYVSSPRAPGRALLLLGIDPLFETPFRPLAGTRAGGDPGLLMTAPSAGLVSQTLAQALGIRAGDVVPITVRGRTKEMRVVGVIEPEEAAAKLALEDVLIFDVATAEELLDQTGRLSRVDLLLPDSAEGARLRQRVVEACDGHCDVVAAGSQSVAATNVTRAFRLNTSALGLLALLVGMFLTYNTMTFVVVERRALFATLRALGVTRRELFAAIVAEAVKLAIPATALGLVAGVVLAKGLVYLVSRTINDLYFVVNVRALSLEPATLAKAACLGLGATVFSTLVPAWEATRVPPGVTFRRSNRELVLERNAPVLAGLGAAMLVAAAILVRVAGQSLIAAFVALFTVVFGAALATPLALRALAAAWTPVAGAALGLAGRMASRGMVTSLTRTSVAVSALMIAVATTVGVSVMVESFRAAVAEWLDQSLRSDLFVQPASGSRRRDEIVAPDVADRIGACPGVAAVNTVRHRRVRTGRGEVDLHVPSYGDPRVRSYRFRDGHSADVYRALDGGDAVAITEPYAFRQRLGVGSKLDVFTDRGRRTFDVAGIYVDYASDEGGIMMSRATYERHFDDRSISGMGLMAEPGLDLAALRERVRVCAGGEQPLVVRPARELRDASLAIFDRTFAITAVLRLLSLLVAAVGILSALSALALERSRELAVLRAMGMTPSQIRRLVTAQTTLLGFSAGILAVPLGFALAAFLVHVINRRSFGWSFELTASPLVVVEALVLAVVAALVSGLYPARAMSRAHPAAALREE